MKSEIKNKVSDYYSKKIVEYGAISEGVDWNGIDSHFLRFEQLCKVILSKKFSLLDYGCGFGSLLQYLNENNIKCDYLGYDISEEMVKKAKAISPSDKFVSSIGTNMYDYTIANGIFNVKLDLSNLQWKEHVFNTIENINTISKKGFSFNVLTSYSDKDLMKDYLYYADPIEMFDFCKVNCSKNVALLHDYKLYEFTIIVRKNYE